MKRQPCRAAASAYGQDRVRECLTPRITGPPNGLTRNHKNGAAAAPVHVLVRWPDGATFSAATALPLGSISGTLRRTSLAAVAPLPILQISERRSPLPRRR